MQKQREPCSESRWVLGPMEQQREGKGNTMLRKPRGFFMSSSNNCSKAHDLKKPSTFFKIMIGDFKDALFIPPKMADTIGGLVKQTIFLEDSNGQTWRVKLSVINGYLAFKQGWDDFVLDHSITTGEFLVFRYIRHSVFDVQVFGTSACERIDFDHEIKKSSSAPKQYPEFCHECSQDSKRQKTSEFSETRCKIGNCGSVKKARKERTSGHNLLGKAINPGSHATCEEKKGPRELERASGHVAMSVMQPKTLTSNYIGAISHVIDEDVEEHEETKICPATLCKIPRSMVNEEEESKLDIIDLCDPKLPYLPSCHSSKQNENGASMLTPNELSSETGKSACHKDKKAISRDPSFRHEKVPDVPCSKLVIDLTKVEDGNSRSTSKKIGNKKPRRKGS